MNTARPHRARGLALLEVVAATALLGIVVVGIIGSATYTVKADARRRHVLGAHELASRLLVVALDDARNLPNPQAVYNDGEFNYRWELATLPMNISIPDRGVLEPRPSGQGAAIASHTKFMIIRIYTTRMTAMGVAEPGGELLAELRRAVNPMGVILRNPDSSKRFMSRADAMAEMANLAGLAGVAPGSLNGSGPIAPARGTNETQRGPGTGIGR